MHPKVLRMLHFFHYFYIYMIYETNIVDIFLNVNVLSNSFCIKNVYVPFGNCKYYASIFYKV